MKNLAQYIDHTALKPDATELDIQKICLEAKEHHFKSVCVNPTWVEYCRDFLRGSDVEICTVIGFPLGANAMEAKAQEAKLAVEQGATEVDMVINIGRLKSEDYRTVARDIKESSKLFKVKRS